MDSQTCSKCGETKPLADFSRSAKQASGLSTQCKRCSNKASREWKAKNKDKHHAQVARWRAKNPERAKENGRNWYARNREQIIAKATAWNKANPDARHDIYIRQTYGVPHGTYDRLLAQQGGKCAICGATEPGRKLKRFHMDHCHDTGKVRGLLCGNCNVGIAQLQHSKEVFLSAMRYLGFEI